MDTIIIEEAFKEVAKVDPKDPIKYLYQYFLAEAKGG
jgi:hypothetical protein